MIGMCPAPRPEAGIVRGLLETVDCNIREGVQGGYEALFGPTSPVTAVITILLTLYVALLGLRLLTGRTDLRVADLPMIALKLGAIVLLTTSWASYQSLVFRLLFDGPAELANTLLAALPPPPGQGGVDIYARLQYTFDQLTQSAAALAKTDDSGSVAAAGQAARAALAAQTAATTVPPDQMRDVPIIQLRSALQGGPAFGATALWLSAVTLLVSTLGLLLLSKLMLGLLLAIGPLFVGMLLFDATKGFFEGWLRTALGFALAPLATVVFMAGLLASLDPSLLELARARAENTYNIAPVMTVLVLVLTFTIVFASVLGMCTRLVAGFRLPDAIVRPPDTTQSAPGMVLATETAAAAAAAPSRAARLVASLGGSVETGDRRSQQMAAAVSFGGAASADRRTEIIAGTDPYRRDIGERLGQGRHRRVAPSRGRTTGNVGSGLRPGGLA